jgi:hypothetical protein
VSCVIPWMLLLSTLLLAQAPPPPPLTDPDAYAVYAAVVPSEWPIRVAHAKRVVIEGTTTTRRLIGGECLPKGPDLEGAWAEALENYKQQNQTTWTLTNSFNLSLPYLLKSRETIDGFFKGRGLAGWDVFNAAYPDARGYMQLSAVGFDNTRQYAIVYVAHMCGGLCGGGEYHFLQLEQDAWREVKVRMTTCMWIS